MKRLWYNALAGATLLLLGAVESSAQESRIFPLRGVVASPSQPGLAIRKNPPEVTAFTYRLADPICGVANGSEFVALEELYLANGEIWFRVYFTKVSASIGGCPPGRLSGWMIAKFKDRWAVSILEQNIALAAPQAATPSRAKPDEASASHEERSSFKPILDYILLLIGTGLAVCIVSIERVNSIRFKQWASSFMVFEFLALSAVNTLIAVLLIDQLSQVPEPSFLFRLFLIVKGSQGGFALLGFLLSVVLMRFISFAKPS